LTNTAAPTHPAGARLPDAVPRGLRPIHPFVVHRSRGSQIWDTDGREYLDFAGGIGCVNVGNGHPSVVAAVQQQAEHALHSAAPLALHDRYVPLCEKLNRLAPGARQRKTFLTNSGVEAVENAVKIARAHTGRSAVISFTNAFHGRTALGSSLSGDPTHPDHLQLAVDIHRTPYPDPYRSSDPHREAERALAALAEIVDGVGAERVAAVIIEPIQGEGGFVIPPDGFLVELSAYCARHGIVTVADEIQTGFARTGRFFASELSGFDPDLLLVGKSIADGLPLAAVIGAAEVMDALPPGGLGGTFGGNAVACAAALAVIDVIEREELIAAAQRIGHWIEARTARFTTRYPIVGDVRVAGAMAAIELVTSKSSKEPARAACAELVRYCADRGIVTIPAGPHRNVLRLLGPLTLTTEELERGFAVIEDGLERLC
jgi:4-aminobutyrate aminotransferase/(S)-3-amino-2-methylpropionate transaminase